ncbi:MAG TPA: HEAT repeat domain-containing protein [Nocardioidaceae bacterium]|nr:HEAT repeat domain-containing protein [Nocardioidaceae bacterium]
MNEPLRALLLTLLLLLGGLAILLVAALVVVRATSELLERRAARRRDEIRGLILSALLGEPEESASALAALHVREGRAWRQVEQQAFAILPKIKGDTRDALVSLLKNAGAAERAYENTRARSAVRRSRGAYQLGALGDRAAVPTLLELLPTDHFLVRRTVVRALGQVRDPEAVPRLLDAVTADPALVRDVIAALQRIGPEATPYLRKDLAFLLVAEHSGRRGALAATVLGLHGDIASVPVLVEAVARAHQSSLRAAAAEALGEIGVPAAVQVLTEALGGDLPEVQVKAAEALGKVGATSALPALVSALGCGAHEVDRAVAEALVKLGGPGMQALEEHVSPYAAEALALRRMMAAV